MPTKDFGTFRKDPKSNTGRLYIPAALVRDSQFPLNEGQVEIAIEGDSVIVKNEVKPIRK